MDPRDRSFIGNDRRAFERALVAHVLADPGILEGRRQPKLTPAAEVLLGIVLETPAAARVALLSSVLISLRAARHQRTCYRQRALGEASWIHELVCRGAARYRDVVRLARDVERLTISELAAIGPAVLVLELLGATPLRRPKKKSAAALNLEISEDAAA